MMGTSGQQRPNAARSATRARDGTPTSTVGSCWYMSQTDSVRSLFSLGSAHFQKGSLKSGKVVVAQTSTAPW